MKLKKVLAVLAIVVVLATCMLVPASAAYIDSGIIGDDYSSNYWAYSLYPLTIRYDASAAGTERMIDVNLGRTVNIRSGTSSLGGLTAGNTSLAFTEDRSYQRSPEGGVKGGSIIRSQPSSGNTEIQYYLRSFVLPDVFAFDFTNDSIIGRNSPYIVFDPLDENIDVNPVGVRFQCAYLNLDGSYSIFSYDLPLDSDRGFYLCDNSLMTALSNVLLESADSESFLVFQPSYTYIYLHNPVTTGATAVGVTYSKNYSNLATVRRPDGSLRNNPFVIVAEEAYRDTRHVTYVESEFDFTSWLSNAFGFFNVPLFGNFTIGGLLSTVVGISLFVAFLKIFAGG